MNTQAYTYEDGTHCPQCKAAATQARILSSRGNNMLQGRDGCRVREVSVPAETDCDTCGEPVGLLEVA